MLIEYVNKGRQVLIDARGEVVNIGRRCWLNQHRANELERLRPGLLVPVAAPAKDFPGVASSTPSPPMPVVADAMPGDFLEADTIDQPAEDAEQSDPINVEPPTVEQVLRLHHSKRKRIAKEITGRKLGASKADAVIKGLSSKQLAEVALKYITEG